MKKKLLLLMALVMILACALLSSCDATGNKKTTDPFAGVTFEDVTGTYNGEAKTMAVANLPAGAVVVYSIDGAEPVAAVSIVDAGTYTVEARMTDADGKVGTKTATMTIAKADYTLENPEQYFATEYTVAYDRGYHTPLPIKALPDGLSFIAVGDPVVAPTAEPATFDIQFAFSDPKMMRNYNPPAGISGIELSVVKGTFDLSNVVFDDATVSFDNAYHSIDITGVPEELNVRVEGGGVAMGQYEVVATFSFKKASDADLYELPAPMKATLSIGIGAVDLPDIFKDKTVYYNGKNLYPMVPEGINGVASSATVVKNADGEEVSEVILPGVYTVTVTFTVSDPDKYQEIAPKTYKLTVAKAPVIVTTDPTWKPVGAWDVTTGDNGGYFILDGAVPGVTIELPSSLRELGAEVECTHKLNGNAVTSFGAAGLYTTTATLTLEHDYYVLPDGYTEFTFTWLVSDKSVNVEDITFADQTVAYDGSAHNLDCVYTTKNEKGEDVNVAGVLGVTILVTDPKGNVFPLGQGFIDAGVYTFTATFETDAAKGYAPLTITKTLTIEKALIDLSAIDVKWDFPLTNEKAYVEFDGKSHVTKLTEEAVAALTEAGVTKISYTGNKAKAVGEYTAVVTLSCGANYTLSAESYELVWQIAPGNVDDFWTPDLVQ